MDQRWYGCKSSLDCPAGWVCGYQANFFGAYGDQFTECMPALTGQFYNVTCDLNRPASQCAAGTSCISYGGGTETDGECL